MIYSRCWSKFRPSKSISGGGGGGGGAPRTTSISYSAKVCIRALFYSPGTQFYGIKGGGGSGSPLPLTIFEWQSLPPTYYISLEREFNGEYNSFQILGKYFDFPIL